MDYYSGVWEAGSGKATAARRELAPPGDGAPKKEATPSDDRQLLVGVWDAVTQEINGQTQQLTRDKGVTFTIKGDNVNVNCKQFDFWSKDYRFRLDAQERPKQMDLMLDGRQELVGIYELNKDTFKFCFTTPENGRPKEFVARGNHFIWVFRRRGDGGAPGRQP
jgi:uncharacterized protein (TIGR03067 family)